MMVDEATVAEGALLGDLGEVFEVAHAFLRRLPTSWRIWLVRVSTSSR